VRGVFSGNARTMASLIASVLQMLAQIRGPRASRLVLAAVAVRVC
jgi:hypothetical protein